MTRRSRAKTTAMRKQLYKIQDYLCPVCDTEIEYGTNFYEDIPSKLVLCQKCYNLVIHMRRKSGPVLDRAIKLIQEDVL